MPGKKKKAGQLRPQIRPQDSMIRDIEAAKKQNLQAISSNESIEGDPEDGLDVADQLMATLAARDRAAINVERTKKADGTLQVPEINHTPHKSRSDQSASSALSGDSSNSTSPRRGPGELLIHAGEKIFGGHHNHSKSPPPISSSDSTRTDGSLASDMQRKGSIRERIFGSSPSREDTTSTDGEKRKVSRQQARKVGVLFPLFLFESD